MIQKDSYAIIGLLAVLFILWACKDSTTTTVDDSFSQAYVEDPPLLLVLKIEKKEYESLRDLKAKFSVRNISNEEVILDLSSTCNYGFTIKQNGDVLFDRNEHANCFPVAFSELHIYPDVTHIHNISFARLPEEFVETVEEGEYLLTAFMTDSNIAKVGAPFTLR